MGSFAWRNLLTRPLRTILALIGLSIPILGVMGLFSVSQGMRNLVGDTLSRVEGVMVLRENSPSPVFSDLEADLAVTLKGIPGVRVVAPEIWKVAPNIEGRTMFSKLMGGGGAKSILDQPVIQGQDIVAHQGLKSAVYPRAMKERNGEGRFLVAADKNKPNIVISKKLAKDYPGADGKPRKVGDSLQIGGRPFHVVGIYDTGSMLLDVVVVMDIGMARDLMGVSKDMVSSYYVETDDATKNDEISQAIEKALPRVDARSMSEFMANFGSMMGQIDKFLMMTVSLALLVGVVGIINTMLMSTTERFVEFGVLRTNGWSQGNILTLVTLESAYLGLLSGVVGCILALVGVMVANQFVDGGVRLSIPAWLYVLGITLSVVTGTLGGLYPAWRAARLVPMDAIRVGSH
ncbi:putative ABC transport system permease protein [Singulisphaera sp. GP187]|uniref:ABC transporter permease n=1 Tax=Singulisphaera sp. GP187 TaxID=1882752 RepID=UPI0009263D9C|nr:ABC transporter permease [Singulisphaera sp. GP187]SIO44067.1 putative ABC transport system permease protein [Singulisphaera sp. GP187]